MTTYTRKGPMFNPPHPGEHLKEDYMIPLGVTSTALASRIGVTRATISRIINARSRIDVDMACALARAFNTTPAIWLRLQEKWDEWQATHQPKRDYSKIRPFTIQADLHSGA
jgi:antitoxin HigA-1